ncbi:small integral membrane protein 26-like [Menidia menidia]
MAFKNLVKWNKRVSGLYALGIWTMICSFGYFKYTGHYDEMAEKIEEQKEANEVKEQEDPDTKVYRTAHSKTTIIYKKDFVPYTTRIYNLFQSFSGNPGPEDGGK